MDKYTKLLIGLSIIGSTLLTRSVISNKKIVKQTKELALTDELTGIYNRRYLNLYLEKAIPLMERSPLNNYASIIDIDNFKQLNDEYGHSFGDKVLKEICQLINNLVRREDCFCRYGGEEFILIATSLEDNHMDKILQRIRNNIEKKRYHVNNEYIHITVSIGVARYEKGDTGNDLIDKADKALYRAKETGKNKICYYR